jgi:hypothetical protein
MGGKPINFTQSFPLFTIIFNRKSQVNEKTVFIDLPRGVGVVALDRAFGEEATRRRGG